MLVFTSCDLTQSDEIQPVEVSKDISFRFKNISNVDMQSIFTTFSQNIATLNAGEATDYIEISRLVVDDDNNITALVSGQIDDMTFNNQQEDPSMINCGAGCSNPSQHTNNRYIRSGTYTLTIDVSSEYSGEGRNEGVHLITRLVSE